MVKSTTSSHYSIFRQRIPDYDLKQVRHYLQYKNRLEGMELCLWELNRSIYLKEVQTSECFAKETMAIWRLFQEFAKHKGLLELVQAYCDCVHEWDELWMRNTRILDARNEKSELLARLQQEYNQMDNNAQLTAKLELGGKIKSLKLELDKNIKQ